MARVPIRPYRRDDAPALAALAAACARSEADFVLNPLWESEDELVAEFGRRGIDPESHLLVAGESNEVLGSVGFLRQPGAKEAGLIVPIVQREQRGQGLGGELLRSALELAKTLGITFVTAAVSTRNRAGYSLLTALGFRPNRQVFVMRCDEPPKFEGLPLPGLRAEPASLQDSAAMLEIYRSCGFPVRSEEEMSRALCDERHAHLVARDEAGVVQAFVELETHWPRRPWVAFVGVMTPLRDRGLGSSLVAAALARQFAQGARCALLALGPANRGALRAYEKVGFRRWRLLDVLERSVP
jgi:ribosomal protein S18 acetylase RimI-like enzyme